MWSSPPAHFLIKHLYFSYVNNPRTPVAHLSPTPSCESALPFASKPSKVVDATMNFPKTWNLCLENTLKLIPLFTYDKIRSDTFKSSRLFLVLSFILYLLLHLRMQPCWWSPGWLHGSCKSPNSTPSTYVDLHQISSKHIGFPGT